MGKRFYCDYCDKTFPYTTDNRKKHNEGSQHQILRNAYYSIKDILEDECKTKPCYKYFVTKNCAYGNSCHCSHLPLTDLNILIDKFQLELQSKSNQTNQADNILAKIKKPKDAQSKRTHMPMQAYDLNNVNLNVLNDHDKNILEKMMPQFRMPDSLKRLEYIPPSLQPPTFNDLINCELNSWGS